MSKSNAGIRISMRKHMQKWRLVYMEQNQINGNNDTEVSNNMEISEIKENIVNVDDAGTAEVDTDAVNMNAVEMAEKNADTVNMDVADKEEKKCCCCGGDAKKTERAEKDKKKLVNRLSRIEGQIRGIKKMIENDAYCNDVLIQSAAVGAAINAFNRELLSNHIHSCVVRDIREGKDEVVDELMVTLQKLIK